MSKMTLKSDKTTRFGTCSKDCYGSCFFLGEWDDQAPEKKLVKATPLKTHPFTQGTFCKKLNNRQQLIYHPDRLKHALIRTGPKGKNEFKEIQLEKALDLIQEKIRPIIDKGNKGTPESILGAFYSGNSGIFSRYAPLSFFNQIGAIITTDGICNEGGIAGLSQLFGNYSITNPLQITNSLTRLIVVWGSDISESNNHMYLFVKKALKNGVKLLVVDNRRTKIAREADHFLFIHPGSDHLVAKLILNRINAKNRIDLEFLRSHVDGYKKVIEDIKVVEEQELIEKTGVDIDQLEEFVNVLINNRHHTIFNIGFGIQKERFGGRIIQAVALLQIFLGNIGKPGTGIIYTQSGFNRHLEKLIFKHATKSSLNKKREKISLITLGSELISRKFKVVFIYNFNPLTSLPNSNILKKALKDPDIFVILHELFLTETAKYADLVIPAKFDVEAYDFYSPYCYPSLSINQGGPCPYPDCLSNYEFFKLLSQKLNGNNPEIHDISEAEFFSQCLDLLPRSVRDDLNKKGYYSTFNFDDVPFNDLKFPTSTGKINLLEFNFEFGKNEINLKLKRNKNQFTLITPSHPRLLHSQLGQIQSAHINDFSKIYLNNEDIRIIDLKKGETVLVSNEFGKGKYILDEKSSLKSGTALIYSGLSSQSENNPNANIFTTDTPEEMGFSGAYNSSMVKIFKAK